jgi:hypothetical protein
MAKKSHSKKKLRADDHPSLQSSEVGSTLIRAGLSEDIIYRGLHPQLFKDHPFGVSEYKS